jgi:hypothetical protein
MGVRSIILVVCLVLGGVSARADDRQVRLAAPQALIESGLLKYVLPRFSLKTQVRVQLVDPSELAELELGSTGTPVFSGPETTWHLTLHSPSHAGAQRLADWLTSDIGRRTITSYAPDGTQLFMLATAKATPVAKLSFDGSAAKGKTQSRRLCGRCHVVIAEERMNAIGSTPSFFVLRTLADWQDRFEAFYALNPHPAFTQVSGVTLPFPLDRPSPIVPVELTLDDLGDILAYVAALTPADLGAPLRHQ